MFLQAVYNGKPLGMPCPDYPSLSAVLKQAFKDGSVPPGAHVDVARLSDEDAGKRVAAEEAAMTARMAAITNTPLSTTEMVGITVSPPKPASLSRAAIGTLLMILMAVVYVAGFAAGKRAYLHGE